MYKYLLILLLVNGFYAGFTQIPDSTHLPIININTDGWLIFDEPKITAEISIIDHKGMNHPGDSANIYHGPVGIELRGKTSQLLSEKKPYALELRYEDGSNFNIALFGMPAEHDWVLLAPYSDKTLMRDMVGFGLARQFDALAYTPRTQWVELIINDDYKGVYVWTEKIKYDEYRVNISKWSKKDEKGSFIIKVDKESGFIFNEYWDSPYSPLGGQNGQRIRFLYHYPKPDDITPVYSKYVKNWMRSFEENLAGNNFDNPVKGYRSFIDTSSFIDFMLMTELSRNVDGYRISSYFYKNDRGADTLLHAGPVWDFNLAFGNANFCDAEKIQGWAWNFNQTCSGDYWLVPFWWNRLQEDSLFREATRRRWKQLRSTTLSDEKVNSLITEIQLPISGGPAARNFERWKIMGQPVWPNAYTGMDWNEEVAYLRNWILMRMQWMDGALAQDPFGQE